MAREYKIEMDISLEENAEPKAIELARKVYLRRGAATRPNSRRQVIVPEEFIDGPEEALIELAEANTLFAEAGIHVVRVACGCSSPAGVNPARRRRNQ